MSRSEYKERTYAWMVEPESLDDLCDFVTDGGTLVEYCAENRLKFRYVRDWIEADSARKTKFEGAQNHRTSNLEDKVLGSLRDAASIDPRSLFNEHGDLIDPKDLPDDIAHSLTEVSTTVSRSGDTTHKIKFTPRHAANEALGRHLGMFRDRMELTGKDGAPLDEINNDALRRIAFALEKGARANEQQEAG